MCGIIGYIGSSKASPIIFDGLKRLEYRGYDSVGICTIDDHKILIEKDIGKLEEIQKKLDFNILKGNVGLGHCRWATHGNVSKENAHPHCDNKSSISIVHNGIIENFQKLKDILVKKGHKFNSLTDTEAIVHLIADNYNGDIEEATRKALKQIEGSYALGIICAEEPDKLIAARNESPLIIGLGKGENFIASDVPAILKYTKKIIYLENNEIAVLTRDNAAIKNSKGESIIKQIEEIDWNSDLAEKSGYEHFMLKEIHEQPRAIAETLNGRIENGNIELSDELKLSKDDLKRISRIIIVACGTSWHAALSGEGC